MTDVRKRKIEHQRERKLAVDQLHAKEKERKLQLPSNMPDPASPKHEPSELEASEIKDDTIEINGSGVFDSDEDARSAGRGLRRGVDRKRKRDEEAARREKERAEKAEAAANKEALKFNCAQRKLFLLIIHRGPVILNNFP